MVGALAAGAILDATQAKYGFWVIYAFLAACLIVSQFLVFSYCMFDSVQVFMIPTLFVTEVPNRVPLGTTNVGEILKLIGKAFYLPWDRYRNLYWVLLSRFLEEMGVSAILPFFLYFLQDIIKVYTLFSSPLLTISRKGTRCKIIHVIGLGRNYGCWFSHQYLRWPSI